MRARRAWHASAAARTQHRFGFLFGAASLDVFFFGIASRGAWVGSRWVGLLSHGLPIVPITVRFGEVPLATRGSSRVALVFAGPARVRGARRRRRRVGVQALPFPALRARLVRARGSRVACSLLSGRAIAIRFFGLMATRLIPESRRAKRSRPRRGLVLAPRSRRAFTARESHEKMMKMDHAGRCAVAAEIASRSPREAAEALANIESSGADPLLAEELRRAIERRANCPQPRHAAQSLHQRKF